ncbi:hypothetical protein HN51_062300, partial [Arachis hypogaea]
PRDLPFAFKYVPSKCLVLVKIGSPASMIFVVLTGGELTTEELGMNIEKVHSEMLGTCKKVTISKDDTFILDGDGDKKAIEETCDQIKSTIENSTLDYDKKKLQKRLTKLFGSVAVFTVGIL